MEPADGQESQDDSGEPVQAFAFDVIDRDGVHVRCTAERWAAKIDFHHPELRGKRAEVAAAIVDPDMVLQDRDYPARRHLVRRTDDGHYIDVVVEYLQTAGSPAGRLITAFIRRRLRRDDDVLFIRLRR